MIDYGFDTADVELDSLGAPLGTHKVMVIGEELKEQPEKPENPRALIVTYEIVEGELKGKQWQTWYNLWHSNTTAQRIAKQELKKIELATGRPVNSSNPLLNRVMTVEVQRQKKNPDFTQITRYHPENYVSPTNDNPPV